MCTNYSMSFDGHEYTLRVDAQTRTTTIICANTQDHIGTIETSPCGEYFIASAAANPLGMASHHHMNGTTLEEVACSVISESY